MKGQGKGFFVGIIIRIMNYQLAEFSWTMHRLGKCHSINYRLCAYIRKPKKGRFYTCIFIEKGFRKALRTDNFKKKAVFVCTFRADRGKYDQNAHIKSMKKPFSYVRLSQIIVPEQILPSYSSRSCAYCSSGHDQDLSVSVSLMFESVYLDFWSHEASDKHIANAINDEITFFIWSALP